MKSITLVAATLVVGASLMFVTAPVEARVVEATGFMVEAGPVTAPLGAALGFLTSSGYFGPFYYIVPPEHVAATSQYDIAASSGIAYAFGSDADGVLPEEPLASSASAPASVWD